MSRIDDILELARYTLADKKKERWSDERLLVLINEAQLDIAKHTRILKGYTYIIPVLGQYLYDLPANCWLVTRATYNGSKIGLATYDELDSLVAAQVSAARQQENNTSGTSVTKDFDFIGTDWEEDTGSKVDALIYDRRDMNEIRAYPIPNNVDTVYTLSDDYGFVVAIDDTEYTFSSVYGVLVGISDPDIAYEDLDIYGVVVQVSEVDGLVKVQYIRMPDTVLSLSAELEIPAMYDVAIKHYVVSQAFNDDNDTRFEKKSKDAALLYDRELGIIDESSAANHRKGSARSSLYRNAFNQ